MPKDIARRILRCIWIILALGAATTVSAQEGYYDQGFGSGGRMLIDVGAANDIGEELALQPDGRMILAGDCSASGKGQWTFCAARLRTDLMLSAFESEHRRLAGEGAVRRMAEGRRICGSKAGWRGCIACRDAWFQDRGRAGWTRALWGWQWRGRG